MEIHTFFDVTSLHTFHIPAKTHFFSEIKSEKDVQNFLEIAQTHLFLILGGGSNLAFIENFSGWIFQNRLSGIACLEDTSSHQILRVKSGTLWETLVQYCINNHLYGIENMVFIPGTVGAAPIQNIGAYGQEVADVVLEIEVIDIHTGHKKILTKDECDFSYRHSVFKKQAQTTSYFIESVVFKFSKQGALLLNYPGLMEAYERLYPSQQSTHLTLSPLQQMIKVIESVRLSKLPDPNILGNSGSFFKNPIIEKTQFEILQTTYEKIPGFPQENPSYILNANRFSGLAQIDSSSLGIPLGGEERASEVYKDIHEIDSGHPWPSGLKSHAGHVQTVSPDGLCERQGQQRGKPKCEEYIKVPAAWLIDQCGFKGKHLGKVGVYMHQPLVLVNEGITQGCELLEAARIIYQAVEEKFHIQLEPEVNLVFHDHISNQLF